MARVFSESNALLYTPWLIVVRHEPQGGSERILTGIIGAGESDSGVAGAKSKNSRLQAAESIGLSAVEWL